jgi:hypothetical protein
MGQALRIPVDLDTFLRNQRSMVDKNCLSFSAVCFSVKAMVKVTSKLRYFEVVNFCDVRLRSFIAHLYMGASLYER